MRLVGVDEGAFLLRLARWGLAQVRHDTHYPSPVPENPKFMTARAAVDLIRDDAVVAVSGLGVHQRAALLFWALREVFAATAHPRRLTVVNLGGHGSRGLMSGTLDDLAQAGLCSRLITGHHETFHQFLALAAAGRCELQCLPLGILALLFDAQARAEGSVLSRTGVGTFLDPRCGRGSPVRVGRGDQLISVEGELLRYRLPRLDVALFNAPAADRRGNIYSKDCVAVGDGREIARAVKGNAGKVIVNVGLLVEEGYAPVFLRAREVDAIVYHPDTEQTLGFFHRRPWRALTPGSETTMAPALAQARFARRLGELAGGMARRSAVDEALLRLTALTLVREARRGAQLVLGAGLPEEVSRVVYEHGRLADFTFQVETGVSGGLPAPGIYFGAMFGPRRMESTAAFFRRIYRRLDVACLGALEVDECGNVNVSRRGPGVRRYSGPGGFTDFATAARTLIFVCGWTRDGELRIENGALHIVRRGKPKFVRRVSEVTFAASEASRNGQKVFYVTPVGVFRLTDGGLELSGVMPGIDIRRDILPSRARIRRPEGEIEVFPASVLTGVGFTLPRPVPKRERRR